MIIEKTPYPFNEEESRQFDALTCKQVTNQELTEEEKIISTSLFNKMLEHNSEQLKYISKYQGSKKKILEEVKEILKAATKEDIAREKNRSHKRN